MYKSPSSKGRGVVGVLEVDFVEPSHDKQVVYPYPYPYPYTYPYPYPYTLPLSLPLHLTPIPIPNPSPHPHPNQDFERTDPMNKLEAKLKLLTPTYWMDEGQRVGYQSANPLPPTQAELRP